MNARTVIVAARLLAAAGLTFENAHGQLPPDRAARAVVDSFFTFVERERWDSAAALIDMTRFEPFFKQQVGIARSALPQRPMTVEDMMANDTTMPRAVAEWEVARVAKYQRLDTFGDVSSEFAGITTHNALFALTAAQGAARWIEAQDDRTQIRASLRRAGCSLESMMSLPMRTTKQLVLAAAAADDSTAYVVHTDSRFTGGDPGYLFGAERVIVLHRTGSRWRIEPRRDLLQPANMSFGFTECPKAR